MVNFPSQNTIKKKKSGSLGKRESSRERRRSTQNIVHRTPSGTRIMPNPEEELLKQVDDTKPPATSQPREGRSGNTTTSPKSSKSSNGKRKSLAAKPPQSPSSKKLMQRRRSMGKTTNTKIVGKNQSVSPKSKKSKNPSKLELKPEVQLASFTTTESSVIDSCTIPSEVSEVQLLPVSKNDDDVPAVPSSTSTVVEDMLSIMITGLGEKYRKYIPNFREHKVTVDQLMYAQFDHADYQRIGIDEQDIPVFMSHFNAGHELSSTLEKTVDEFQTAADITPTEIQAEEPVQATLIPDETVENLEAKPVQICKADDAVAEIEEQTLKQNVEEIVEKFEDIIKSNDDVVPVVENLETDELEQVTTENVDQVTPESVEEEAAKLIQADLEKQQTTTQPADPQDDELMTEENVRDVLINSADKIHELEARLAKAEEVIKEQPEEVLLQKNTENLANDKVPIEGIKDELQAIANVVEETKVLGEQLAEKIKQNVEVSDESGLDQGESANTSELQSEANSKESHNTSTSSTSSITDVKKYALIFGTAGILSVGMYKFLRR